MGVVFKLQLTDLSPQLVAGENGKKPPLFVKLSSTSQLGTFWQKLAIDQEINIPLSGRQREWLKPATRSKKYFTTSSNRTKICELYSVREKYLSNRQPARFAKRQPYSSKNFLHLTTDNFLLKSGVGKLTTLKFLLLLFVTYFFSI